MKKVIFNNSNDFKRQKKNLSIRSRTQDEDSITTVEKSFTYKISKTDKVSPKLSQPQVYIRKSFDTRKRIERFSVKIKGYFFITHNRVLKKVSFHHKLNIRIDWKSMKDFSPKKSAVLTE